MLARVEVMWPKLVGAATFELPPNCARGAQLHMVRSVEHLHAELESLSLGDAEILDRREIDVHLMRPLQVVARAVAILPGTVFLKAAGLN